MSRHFTPVGMCCYGIGAIDDSYVCQAKPHEADCTCNVCSGDQVKNTDYCVRCSDCGSVFQPFHSWHESATGKARCLPGTGTGHYAFKNRNDLTYVEIEQARATANNPPPTEMI